MWGFIGTNPSGNGEWKVGIKNYKLLAIVILNENFEYITSFVISPPIERLSNLSGSENGNARKEEEEIIRKEMPSSHFSCYNDYSTSSIILTSSVSEEQLAFDSKQIDFKISEEMGQQYLKSIGANNSNKSSDEEFGI
ncbi:hypothetical protein Glove_543g41 [Diversispora epigaea]|uniref:Uncharacterized protein n=1 Tax=Diversispora epigaea TaxID=1348612 RepID=A0A397GG82_9GLOM|nr:hypothetical protein Glove_543g41 [Diversispora epigaea]